MAAYAMAVVLGPGLGPIVGAALVVQPRLGWRWTEYLSGILQITVLIVDVIFLDESYPPRLLVYKARRLRHQSGNWALHAKLEEWDVSIGELARKVGATNATRKITRLGPWAMLTASDLVLSPADTAIDNANLFSDGALRELLLRHPIYAAWFAPSHSRVLFSFTNVLYTGAIPLIFEQHRGWRAVPASVPFSSLLLGSFLGAVVNIYNQMVYNKKAAGRVAPELRLPPMMLGSVFFSAGLFVTGWTADPSHPWIAPVIGIAMTGFGFFTVFQAALNYLVDTFSGYAASAVAANTFLRSCFAGA
jgi:MFS family permease